MSRTADRPRRVRPWRGPTRILAFVLPVAVAVSCAQGPALDETRRLAGLCEVWGLLKYYHPQVAQRADWDTVLVSFVSRIQTAETQDAFNREIRDLVDQAGSTPSPSADAVLDSHFRWIDDQALFLPETSRRLRAVVATHRPGPNRYVAATPGVGNPDFSGDDAYFSTSQFPDQPTRMLALFRYWNMVQYFFPYRDVMDRDWLEVLPDLIPRFAGATSALEYHQAVAELTTHISDSHASVSSPVLGDYFGLRRVPLDLRLVENRTVVTLVFPRLYDRAFDLRAGDVVTGIDGVPPEQKRATLRTLLSASNEARLERDLHDTLQRTNAARVVLTVQGGDGRSSTWDVNTVPLDAPWNDTLANHGPVSAILPGNIGYVHMGWLQVADVTGVMEQVRNTRAIVFDSRNYPNGTLYHLANYLNPTLRPFAKFQKPDFDHPGGLLWTRVFQAGPGSPDSWGALPKASYTYAGRVVVLVNEETISQAEYTVMALRTAPDVTVIGSQTAGADGNVSSIRLPGAIATRFTGLGVFYPDGTPTQRVGIVPDIVVRPTIQGLREGRDEVLEAALAFLD